MTRLRLAPSSPERRARLLRRLRRSERAHRLLLRWFAVGRECYQWASIRSMQRGASHWVHFYRLAWCTEYPDQYWPEDGDERLREELEE